MSRLRPAAPGSMSRASFDEHLSELDRRVRDQDDANAVMLLLERLVPDAAWEHLPQPELLARARQALTGAFQAPALEGTPDGHS